MPFSLPANFNPGDSYTNVHANNVAAAINSQVNGIQTAYVAALESTTSATYTDLATTTDQVTVTIGQSGTAIMFLSALLYNSVPGWSYIGYVASGANTIAVADAITAFSSQGGAGWQFGITIILTALSPGATTFKMKYKATTSTTGSFGNRRIAVIPFP